MYWMKKGMILLVVMTLHLSMMAQAPTPQSQQENDSLVVSEEAPIDTLTKVPLNILDANQLKRAKWYTSIDEAMGAKDKVYKLSLTNKKMIDFPMEVFSFPNLQVLDISGNRFKEIPEDIIKLRNLQVLNIYNNRLRVLPFALKDMEALHTIYAARNRLTEIPVWIGGAGKLRKLDVSFNYLTENEINRAQEMLPRCEISH